MPTLLVTGEVSGFRGPARTGHCYFQLKDDGGCHGRHRLEGHLPGERRAAARRPAGARWRALPESTRPRGALVRGTQLEVSGEGLLRQQVAALARRLEAEGLMDPSRKRPIPRFCTRVAVVTSPTGSVIDDVKRTLARRNPLVEVLVSGCAVQGEGAPQQIIHALAGGRRRPSRRHPARSWRWLLRGPHDLQRRGARPCRGRLPRARRHGHRPRARHLHLRHGGRPALLDAHGCGGVGRPGLRRDRASASTIASAAGARHGHAARQRQAAGRHAWAARAQASRAMLYLRVGSTCAPRRCLSRTRGVIEDREDAARADGAAPARRARLLWRSPAQWTPARRASSRPRGEGSVWRAVACAPLTAQAARAGDAPAVSARACCGAAGTLARKPRPARCALAAQGARAAMPSCATRRGMWSQMRAGEGGDEVSVLLGRWRRADGDRVFDDRTTDTALRPALKGR